ncbi:right-handed parallel beta-helix repeat-containing protein [Hoyosella rhizosphaerae]|uniref:Right handed beta helix domain-containing protein n=1 Tax=Hoyosella rhizosphaerae TaxID=1755582 RepID=A0A916UCB9_9ACTN|nr:right-handed parallel beta-helix repeat-containing protein [Hoyosella rhizosphaerae]MBN4925889.1 right-handed parallel beta-helix repeat-containing protein [Hoyosella rhizosphaerae]GGC67162.1 hypothetical protein GCM10011410_19790 [Hoyosella rhizosphaerae]
MIPNPTRALTRRGLLQVGGLTLAGTALGFTAVNAAGSKSVTTPITLFSNDRYIVDRNTLLNADDASVVIQNALDAAEADGISTVELPEGDHGDYLCYSPIATKGRSLTGTSTTLTVAGAINAKALITASGRPSGKATLERNATAGDTRVQLPSPLRGVVTAGSIIGIEARTSTTGPEVAGTPHEVWACEFRQVTSTQGPWADLDSALIWDYPTTANAQAYVVDPVRDFRIEGLNVTSRDPLNHRVFAVQVRESHNASLDIALTNAGGGVIVNNSLNTKVHTQVNTLPNYFNEYGYGLTVAGASASVQASVSGGDCRHIFTTAGDTRSGANGFEQWGDPRHVTVTGSGTAGPNSFAVFDTHPAGYDIRFSQCSADGGGADATGFQIRNHRATLTNCSSVNAGLLAVRMGPGMASKVSVIGGSFTGAAKGGIGIAEDSTVTGSTIRQCGGAGIIINDSSSRAHINNCVIEENHQFGIQDQSSGEHVDVVIKGNTIPRSDEQYLGVLFPKSNMLIDSNHFAGFDPPDSAAYKPGPNVQIVNNTG